MWVSPDGKIQKMKITEGIWGEKPSEESDCEVLISDCPESLIEYNSSSLVIGDSDDYFRRMLDICLSTMNKQEVAKFKISPENITFTLKLVNFKSNGYIHEWNPKKKLEIAQRHKEKGVALYKLDRFKDAAYRFTKALKILHSIPMNAETPSETIDDIPVDEINKLKANLYNNLASYYLKKEAWLLTVDTCNRVFVYEKDSVKAHYKLAVAYMKDRNWELAHKELNIVLAAEPHNKAAIEYMKTVRGEIHKANIKVNMMVKKMFQ